MIIGLITEGPTDQIIIKQLLAKYLGDPNIDTRTLQPNTDCSDIAKHFGGWGRVFDYCASSDFETALQAMDFVLIQLDTDVCEEYGVKKRIGDRDVHESEIIEEAKTKLIQKMGISLYRAYKGKIILAISHGSLECWLLPLYFNDNNRKKTMNCCNQLNQALKKEGFTIDCNHKAPLFYNKICKNLKNKAQILKMKDGNLSFNDFINRLDKINAFI